MALMRFLTESEALIPSVIMADGVRRWSVYEFMRVVGAGADGHESTWELYWKIWGRATKHDFMAFQRCLMYNHHDNTHRVSFERTVTCVRGLQLLLKAFGPDLSPGFELLRDCSGSTDEESGKPPMKRTVDAAAEEGLQSALKKNRLIEAMKSLDKMDHAQYARFVQQSQTSLDYKEGLHASLQTKITEMNETKQWLYASLHTKIAEMNTATDLQANTVSFHSSGIEKDSCEIQQLENQIEESEQKAKKLQEEMRDERDRFRRFLLTKIPVDFTKYNYVMKELQNEVIGVLSAYRMQEIEGGGVVGARLD